MKKLISAILSVGLLAGLLAACGGQTSSGNGAASTPGADATNTGEVDYGIHETFTYWLYSSSTDYYSSYSDNPVTQYLNQKFNVTIEFEQPASGAEIDSLSLMFGTGEYTDVIDMSYYTGSIAELYEDGVLVNIADYLEYMPNFKNLLDKDDNFRKTVTDDDGRILTLKTLYEEPELQWGGLVYRRDILEIMTGGYITFPSGQDEPTTIEDWEYMLPLYKAYFEAAGFVDYAPFILPYNGYFPLSQMASGFGVASSYYLDGDTVKYGPAEDGFYNYLLKMKEWYETGYIYSDFASRTNDPFYVPNTDLTYGGAAGVWFGLSNQIGDTMSMPEYDLYYDVHAIASPLDAEHGITEAFPYNVTPTYDSGIAGVAVTTACQNLPKLLSILDYMYSEEGGMIQINGLTAEQAENIEIYQKNGMEDGTYAIVDGEFVYNSLLTPAGGTMETEPFCGVRYAAYSRNSFARIGARAEELEADEIWSRYSDSTSGIGKLPSALSRPVDEDKLFVNNNTNLTDYVDTMIPKFIMGTEPLDEASWEAFVAQLNAYGLEENLRILQDAYTRYQAR